MTPKPPARRAKQGRAKPVKAVPLVKAYAVANDQNIANHLVRHEPGGVYLQPWERWIEVLIVPADGSYIVKRKEPRRGK